MAKPQSLYHFSYRAFQKFDASSWFELYAWPYHPTPGAQKHVPKLFFLKGQGSFNDQAATRRRGQRVRLPRQTS